MLDDAESAFLLRLSLLLTPGLAELKTFKQLDFFFSPLILPLQI